MKNSKALHAVDGALRSPLVGLAISLSASVLVGSLPLPAQGAAPYTIVTQTPIVYQSLPLPNGGPVSTLTLSGGSTDDGTLDSGIPFSVRFFGVDYDSINIGTNGYLTFGPNADADCYGYEAYATPACNREYSNDPIPSNNSPNRLVAVWWDDMKCDAGTLESQVLGTAPNRQYVVQWDGCYDLGSPSSTIQAQVWLTEGSSSIEVRYGTKSGSPSFTASVGIESPVDTGGVESYVPSILSCTPSCGASDWPTNTSIRYSQGPDLGVASVTGEEIGYAGIPMHMEAVVTNVGGKPALGFTGRFLVGAHPMLDDTARELGVVTGTFDLDTGETALLTLDAPLPADLEPGTWYLLAEADPFQTVPETNRTNNVGVSLPFTVGVTAPDLVVRGIDAPLTVVPDSDFTFPWTIRNDGNATGIEVPYLVVLSRGAEVTVSDLVLFKGAVPSVAPFGGEEAVENDLHMPATVEPGLYYLGVILDPEDAVSELRDRNNLGVSDPVLVAGGELEVVTDSLPSTALGSPYCVKLQAMGGNGIYVWSAPADSTLPAGLTLQETPPDARLAGRPFSTSLCGRTRALGAFDFTVQVTSAGQTASRALHLDVSEEGRPLHVVTDNLPVAPFHGAFTTPLQAVGGVAPYTWTIAEGRLTSGLQLRSDGAIVGSAEEDAPESFTVEVRDSEGRTTRQALTMNVLSPDRLSCGTRWLPTHSLGEEYTETLHAAGGTGEYVWGTLSTTRASTAKGEIEETLAGPPPGLALSPSGQVTGEPTAAGSYQWRLTLADDSTSTECVVLVEIRADQGLTIATQHLPAATAGEPYRVTLESKGASNPVWLLVPGAELPDGLTLAKDGTIEGTPPLDQLDGEPSRTYAFDVEVWDESNRHDEQALSITVNATHPQAKVLGEEKTESGGCQAGPADPSLLALLAGAGLGALRRRRR